MHTDILTPKDLFQKDVRYTFPPFSVPMSGLRTINGSLSGKMSATWPKTILRHWNVQVTTQLRQSSKQARTSWVLSFSSKSQSRQRISASGK